MNINEDIVKLSNVKNMTGKRIERVSSEDGYLLIMFSDKSIISLTDGCDNVPEVCFRDFDSELEYTSNSLKAQLDYLDNDEDMDYLLDELLLSGVIEKEDIIETITDLKREEESKKELVRSKEYKLYLELKEIYGDK